MRSRRAVLLMSVQDYDYADAALLEQVALPTAGMQRQTQELRGAHEWELT